MPHCCSARAQCGGLFDRQTHTETLRHHPPPHPAPVSPQPVRSEQSSSPSPERAPWPAPDRQLLGAPASPCAPPRSWRFFSARGKVSERGPLGERFLDAPDCPEVQAPRSAACPSMPSLRRGEFSAPRTAPRLPPDPAEWPRRRTRRPDSLTPTPDPAGQAPCRPHPTSGLLRGQRRLCAVAGQGHLGRWEDRCWLPCSPFFLLLPTVCLPLTSTSPKPPPSSLPLTSPSFPSPLGSLCLSLILAPPQSHPATGLFS